MASPFEYRALYVDGACNKETGPEGWGSVVDAQGRDLLPFYSSLFSDLSLKEIDCPKGKRWIVKSSFNDVATQQHNGAELLALIAGLRIALSNNQVKEIRSDSAVALFWSVKLKKKSAQKMDPLKVHYIQELMKLSQSFKARGGVLTKISGDHNLADLGWHK